MSLNSILGEKQSLSGIDATNTAIDHSHTDGTFKVTVERAELRENRTGTGKHVSVMCRTVRGVVWHNFNVLNPAVEVQSIGRHQFKLFCNSLRFSELPSCVDLLIGEQCMMTIGDGNLQGTLPADKEVLLI